MNTSDRIKKYIENVKRWPRRAGKALLLRFLEGKHLTPLESIKAMCYSCTSGEGTGCTVPICPLLPHSPYGGGCSSDPD